MAEGDELHYCSVCGLASPDYEYVLTHQCEVQVQHETSTPKSGAKSGGFSWLENPTKLLIATYALHKDKFNNPHYKKKNIWEMIAIELKNNGYSVSRAQVENKFKALHTSYRKIKDHNRQSGNDRKTFAYYKEMEELFSDCPGVNPLSSSFSSGGIFSSEVENNSSSSDPNVPSSSPGPSTSGSSSTTKNKKRKREEEPEWFTKFRDQIKKQHDERIEQQKSLLEVFKGMAANKKN